MDKWPIHPPIPNELLVSTLTTNAIFLDTNILLRQRFLSRLRLHGSPVISSVVFGEFLTRRPSLQWHETALSLMNAAGVRVVPIGPEDAQWYWELFCRQELRFDQGPLCRAGEDARRCRDRLRFDLLVFAVALRHRKMLVTDNRNDF